MRTWILGLLAFAPLLAQATPPVPPQPNYPDYVYKPMTQFVAKESMLDVRELFHLGPAYHGRRIEFVTVKARSTRGIGQATLMINGTRNGENQYIDGAARDLFFMPGEATDEFLTEVQLLKLYVKGEMIIDGLGVKFASDGHHPPPQHPIMESVRLDATFVGNGALMISDYVNLQRYRGLRLTALVVHASSPHLPPIPGDMAFCTAHECSQWIRLTPNSREQRFYPHGEFVDRDARAWRLHFQGGMRIRGFTLQFSRN